MELRPSKRGQKAAVKLEGSKARDRRLESADRTEILKFLYAIEGDHKAVLANSFRLGQLTAQEIHSSLYTVSATI
jgi:hypothetical protein